MPSTLVAFNTACAPISAARSTAVVSVVKNGLPVPPPSSTIRPSARYLCAAPRVNSSQICGITNADRVRAGAPRRSIAASSATQFITVASMPTVWPARASPGLRCGRGICRRLLLAAGRRDLGCEIGFLLLDSLAQSIAHKSRDLHRRADLTLSFLDGLCDRLGVIVDEGLFQQAYFLVVGLETRLDDLLD